MTPVVGADYAEPCEYCGHTRAIHLHNDIEADQHVRMKTGACRAKRFRGDRSDAEFGKTADIVPCGCNGYFPKLKEDSSIGLEVTKLTEMVTLQSEPVAPKTDWIGEEFELNRRLDVAKKRYDEEVQRIIAEFFVEYPPSRYGIGTDKMFCYTCQCSRNFNLVRPGEQWYACSICGAETYDMV